MERKEDKIPFVFLVIYGVLFTISAIFVIAVDSLSNRQLFWGILILSFAWWGTVTIQKKSKNIEEK